MGAGGFGASRRRAIAWAMAAPMVLALAMYLPGVWYDEWPWDPGMYAAISLRAARTGEWWTLHHSNVTYFNKPPLWFWAHALSVRVLGESTWALRLPDLLAALGCVWMLTAMVVRLHGPRVAMIAGVGLALCGEYYQRISQFRLDIAHALFMLTAAAMVVRGVTGGGGGSGEGRFDRGRWWIMLAGVPIGLGLLTKPLFALAVIPIMGAWMACSSRRRMRRGVVWLAPATGVALLVAAPWHVSMWWTYGEAFVNAYFVRESLTRATGTNFKPDPWYAYLLYLSGVPSKTGVRLTWQAISAAQVPWMVMAAVAIGWWVVGGVRGKRLAPRISRDGARLAQFWTFSLIAGLSAFADKKSWYLAPVFPGLSWIAALAVDFVARHAGRLRRVPWTVMRAAAPLALVVVLVIRPSFERPNARPVSKFGPLAEWIAREPMPAGGYVNGSLHHYDGVALYMATGVWPRFAKDDNTGERIEIGAGSMIIFDMRRGGPDASDEVLVRDGTFVLVRRSRGDAAGVIADTMPGK